jgi:hypothetical protein
LNDENPDKHKKQYLGFTDKGDIWLDDADSTAVSDFLVWDEAEGYRKMNYASDTTYKVEFWPPF